jgi:hypothetical protein
MSFHTRVQEMEDIRLMFGVNSTAIDQNRESSSRSCKSWFTVTAVTGIEEGTQGHVLGN